MNRLPVAILFAVTFVSGHASCFEQAGARYGVAPVLLEAISPLSPTGIRWREM
jgi:hypothetical protein